MRWVSFSRIDFGTARRKLLLAKRLAACRSLHGDLHTDTGIAIGMLGDILCDQGRYHSALKLQQRAASILEKTVGVQSEHFLQTQLSLGDTYLQLTRVEEAVKIFRRSEGIAVRLFGWLNTLTLKSQAALINAWICSGEFLEAEQLAESLKLLLSQSSPDPETRRLAFAVDLNLGNLLLATSRLDEAGELLQPSERKAADFFGPEHPNTLTFLHSIAEFFKRSGRFDEAISTIDKCITSRVVVLGSSHPHIKVSMHLKEQTLDLIERRRAYQERSR